jgi:hypothetical protein
MQGAAGIYLPYRLAWIGEVSALQLSHLSERQDAGVWTKVPHELGQGPLVCALGKSPRAVIVPAPVPAVRRRLPT